jgi:hypothetical protein
MFAYWHLIYSDLKLNIVLKFQAEFCGSLKENVQGYYLKIMYKSMFA